MNPSEACFAVARRNGRWWLITPGDEAFWSIGMNHIDSAALRHEETAHIWRDKYANSEKRWIREAVVPDLRRWGFNTIGWTQEVVTRGHTMHRHSRSFTYEEYQWASMPYCHLLPFAEVHQWEAETKYPDVFSRDFEQWCEYVARKECARMADDPKLIGYFYVDCPSWVHCPKWNAKGPWLDPKLLGTGAGRRKLAETARRYYQVTHDAIRRYDSNHLILGDRYEAKAPLPEEILLAAADYVDVMSFQYFARPERIGPDLARWSKLTGKPVLLADAAAPGRSADGYRRMIRSLRELDCCVGWHVCGAYLTNRCRKYGFREEDETPQERLIEAATEANRETAEYVRAAARG